MKVNTSLARMEVCCDEIHEGLAQLLTWDTKVIHGAALKVLEQNIASQTLAKQ